MNNNNILYINHTNTPIIAGEIIIGNGLLKNQTISSSNIIIKNKEVNINVPLICSNTIKASDLLINNISLNTQLIQMRQQINLLNLQYKNLLVSTTQNLNNITHDIVVIKNLLFNLTNVKL